MGKIAFVFSGQGDQFPGMGKELYEKYPVAKEIFDACDEIRKGTKEQCFFGSDEELKETKNTQPCLFAMEYACAKVLSEHGIAPSAVAGFSLGEVVASAFAEVFDLQTGFSLVCKRGELMQAEAEKHDTSMAAVVKLDNEKVAELCSSLNSVYPVNFNCPGQVSVAGLSSEMAKLADLVKAEGGRAIPLKVKGAFHSPFIQEASKGFLEALCRYECKKPSPSLYSNVTAMPYGENIKELLSKQISSPVKWEELIRNMIASGVDTFIEIGPGKTLTNMIKKIDGTVRAYSGLDLDTVLAEVK